MMILDDFTIEIRRFFYLVSRKVVIFALIKEKQ